MLSEARGAARRPSWGLRAPRRHVGCGGRCGAAMLGVAGGLGRGHGHKRGAPGTAPAGGGQRGAAGPAAPGSHGAEPARHGLARRCWRGGCGAPMDPHTAPPAPLLSPGMGSPNPAGLRGHTHCWAVKRGTGLCTPPCACSRSSPRAGHPLPAAPHRPGPTGRRWKRWGRAPLLASTAAVPAVPCAVPAPPAPPPLQALGPLLVSPAAAPGPRGGRQRLPAGTHPAPAWLPGGAVLQPRAPGPGLWGAGIQEAPKPPSVAARSTWAPHRPSLRAVGGPLCLRGPNRFLWGLCARQGEGDAGGAALCLGALRNPAAPPWVLQIRNLKQRGQPRRGDSPPRQTPRWGAPCTTHSQEVI